MSDSINQSKKVSELTKRINQLEQATHNPLICDDPHIRISSVVGIIDYLLSADEHKENHGLSDKYELQYSNAKRALLQLTKGALDYEVCRVREAGI